MLKRAYRLDATNILDPMLSIITSIGMDHTEILGDTLEKLPLKRQYYRNDCPILIGDLPPIAESEITEIALKKAPPYTPIKCALKTNHSQIQTFRGASKVTMQGLLYTLAKYLSQNSARSQPP